jgi:Probable cobalt transporter subunit (CbtB)
MHEAVAALPRVEVADRVAGAAYLFAGWTLVYLVLFDQGAILDLLLGSQANGLLFHELFHDGRHFALVPCD